MKYKITKHYLKTKEVLIAAFFDLKDAEIFIVQKIDNDEINRTKVLYRVYDDNDLVREFTNETSVSIDPEDAETYSNAQFFFNVTIQAKNSLERIPLAYFNFEEDANLFVAGKCCGDDKLNSQDIFLIFKEQVLIATLNRTIMDNKALKNLATSRGTSSATLSPLSRRPTPPGGPNDYWVDKDDMDE